MDQTNLVYSTCNDDQGRIYQNFKFHDPDPWDRGSLARARPYKSYTENGLFL